MTQENIVIRSAEDAIRHIDPEDELIRKPAVKKLSGINADSSLYDLIREGKFPRPLKISARSSAWLKSEVLQWRAEKLAERDNKAA